MKSALVTGAHGFVGRYVARRLARDGYFVEGLGHGTWGSDERAAWGLGAWRATDVTLESLVTYGGAPDLIIHCAGSGSVGYSITNPHQDFQRSVDTTIAVLESVRLRHAGTKVVILSSAGVYGNANGPLIGVDQPCAPLSPYGWHKLLVEQVCRSYAQNFHVNCAVVRLFSLYGVGLRKQLLWDACRKISSGELVFAGTGQETRDWLHVEDAADLLLAAANHADGACPVVNGGSGVGVDVRRVVGWIADGLGDGKPPLFSGEARAGDPVRLVADIKEALAWGWTPKRKLEEEITGYLDWFARGAR